MGLNVIGTVCDQGSNNAKAIKLLLEETEEMRIRKNEENRCFGFSVLDREVIPLYDVPHLFKGLRNNLLNKDLYYEKNGVKGCAKWIHIQQLFALDNRQPLKRLYPKLTEQHIDPEKIKTMKVKMCTQVFSHSICSLLTRIPGWGKNFFF